MEQARFQSHSPQVRLADLREAEVITSVINAAFRRAESFLLYSDRIDRESVQTLLEKGKFLIAEDAGLVVGCVYLELKGERAYLGLLSVAPERQKAGLGSLLMDAAEDYGAKAGCRFMDLRIVNVRRELPSFYHRRGYIETGVTTPFHSSIPTKIPCHFVEMSKPLA